MLVYVCVLPSTVIADNTELIKQTCQQFINQDQIEGINKVKSGDRM